MPFEMLILILTILLGAVLQVGVGIGFSIIAGPMMMLSLGTQSAVPILLALNVVVSAIAVPGSFGKGDRSTVAIAALGCVVGIGLGIVVYSRLTEAAVLSITGVLLLIGAATTLMPFIRGGRRVLLPVSGLSGLATVWAATPGPLMALGLILSGYSADQVRRLVQPIALVAYSVAFVLHAAADWNLIVGDARLGLFLGATVAGSAAGRLIGPALPHGLIGTGIRIVSVIAGVTLLYRAATLA